MAATGPESTPLDEAARQISEIGWVSNAPGRFGRPKRGAPSLAETLPDRVLARQLIVGVLVSDFLVSQLCAVTGQTREQLLGELAGNLPQPVRDRQLDVLLLELSGSCALLQGDVDVATMQPRWRFRDENSGLRARPEVVWRVR